MTGNTGKYNVNLTDASSFRRSSLTSSNFSYSLSDAYKSGGVYRTQVTINYRNHNNVDLYYASNLGKSVYLVPFKFNVTYTDLDYCVRDLSENASKYTNYTKTDKRTETVWVHRIPTYKWSTSKTLSGYEYTGEYEDREK